MDVIVEHYDPNTGRGSGRTAAGRTVLLSSGCIHPSLPPGILLTAGGTITCTLHEAPDGRLEARDILPAHLPDKYLRRIVHWKEPRT